MYLGDFRLGDTFDIKFTTVDTSGVPITLAGTPVISAYPGNSTTELTGGITLTVDFDSRTGMHNVRVVASSGNGYAAATNYILVITTGTIGGSSAVGYVIGGFSIENRSALMPTTAARTLDVSAGGEAGVDWANVGSPTTALGLSGTTIKTATDVATAVAGVQSDTDDIQARIPAALVSGRMDSSVGAMAANVVTATAIATDAITASKIAADAIGASELAADAVTEIADGLLKRDMSAVSGESARSPLNALRFLRNKWAIAAGTLSVKKEDDSTEAWNSAMSTDAAAVPIIGSDPA